MQRLLLSLTFLVLALPGLAESVEISGRLLNEQQQPIANSKVTINQQQTSTDPNGYYRITAKPTDIYQISIKAKSYYPSIQSFSHYELFPQKSQSTNIANITLVEQKAKRVMLAFGGDVMMGRRYYKPYFGDEVLIHPENKLADSKAIVENVKPYLSLADYAAVNLETQIATSKPEKRAPKGVTFYSQPEILDALSWSGVDYVTLGNNHTYDYLDSGLDSTLAALKQSDLGYSGAGINTHDALKAYHQTINDNDYAMLGYVGWEGSARPSQTANDKHGGAAYGSMDNILTSVKREVAQHKTIIVQYHGSQEYANSPTGVTEQRLKSALDQGAALAVAHHPHVTQGLELYNGKLIAYSMGNFIFDQNFSATQHSFILYVWLDEGRFHRAEIAPIYVKGYKPTPATGIQRNTVMKRLKTLSQARNTFITMNAGHGVITAANQAPANKLQQYVLNNNESANSLYHLPWNNKIQQVILPSSDLKYRLGVNLINGSNLENFTSFNSAERGWLFNRDTTTAQQFTANGSSGLQLELASNTSQWFGMQSFRRVYKASYPMTINTSIRALRASGDQAVIAKFYWQGRKKRGQKLFDALKNSKKHFIGAVELAKTNDWQEISLDFNSPRVGYRSYRVLVEFENTNNKTVKLDIDDFSLIEWQTAFSNTITPASYDSSAQLATFIGFNKPTNQPITIEVSDY